MSTHAQATNSPSAHLYVLVISKPTFDFHLRVCFQTSASNTMSQNQSWSLLIDIWRATEQKGRRSHTRFERKKKNPLPCVCVYIDSHTLTHSPHQPPPLPNTGGYCLQHGALLAAGQISSGAGLVLLQSTGSAGPPWQTKCSLHKQLLTISYPSVLHRQTS